jgi:hypothetical protein
VGLLERERDWQRPRLFARWDALGGPSRWARWWYRRPVSAALLAALVVGGLAFALGRVPVVAALFVPYLWWQLRSSQALLAEWEERGPADPVPRPADDDAPRGLLARWDRRNQYRGEVDNAAYVESDGDWDAQVSPLLNRYWQLHVGWLAVVAVGALLWWGATALLR